VKNEGPTFINYKKWQFLVADYKPRKAMRAFVFYEFWQHIAFVSFVYFLHDYQIYQVCLALVTQLAFLVAYIVCRPGKTKKKNFAVIFEKAPICIAYCFTFFSLYREIAILRWGGAFRYYLVGLGVVISFWLAWAMIIARVFFYTFTGLWEWGNKITEKCRGAESVVIVSLISAILF
jgi:hypothetical protein